MVTRRKRLAIASELICASMFIEEGYEVFFPHGEGGMIDLVIFKNNKFQKVQVKTTKPKNGTLILKLTSTNNWQIKKYTKESIDLMCLYDYENKDIYLVDMKEVSGHSAITLRLDKTKNNQSIGVRFAKDYKYIQNRCLECKHQYTVVNCNACDYPETFRFLPK